MSSETFIFQPSSPIVYNTFFSCSTSFHISNSKVLSSPDLPWHAANSFPQEPGLHGWQVWMGSIEPIVCCRYNSATKSMATVLASTTSTTETASREVSRATAAATRPQCEKKHLRRGKSMCVHVYVFICVVATSYVVCLKMHEKYRKKGVYVSWIVQHKAPRSCAFDAFVSSEARNLT